MGFEKENESVREERQRAEDRRKKKLAEAITADFNLRREERRQIESGWLLNMNFLSGNQYCDVSPFGGIVEEDKRFYWQSRRVFNHIAPTIDSRIAKLTRLRPTLKVKAFSDEDADMKAAKLATGIISYAGERARLFEAVSRATLWSETCGSAFYKIVWNGQGGRQVGESADGAPVYEGEVQIVPLSPFGIFPDRVGAEGLDGVQSLIHAEIVPVSYVFERFGVVLKGETIDDPALSGYSEPSAGKEPMMGGERRSAFYDSVILIERYTRPSQEAKNGRLEIVAGGMLLYEGELPYLNGERGERIFPFVKQDCLRLPGAFFASSVIDRLIPVQRAYNAVRNRKHEFLNRISMGVMTVEDGSVDTDELTEEGLCPGKVLVYRQGGKAPEMLDTGSVPSAFKDEEEWLEKEFSLVSGVSDLSQNSTPARVTSATGLQLLLSQDDSRLSATSENIAEAIREIGRQIIRLYKQFAGTARLITMVGENKKTAVAYFNAAELSANDIVFEAEEISSPEEKRETVLRLLEAGLLTDEDGKISKENKNRVLEAFGFGSYENARDISALHIAKAEEENLLMTADGLSVDCYDDHGTHILEHTRFLLSEGFKKRREKEALKRAFEAHLKEHERMKAATVQGVGE
ncbi:MAG: hypothetical protein IJY62_05575 [Clostridia bacterium]|nr:hypothetical protein [Clostridia bacterium]